MDITKNSMILAQNCYYSMNCRKTKLNNNVLVVGTSGAGKTRTIVTPNILQAYGSYVISDPKGNLYKEYEGYLKNKGYEVCRIDFVHPERSVGYNPLSFIRNTQDIIKIASILTHNENPNRADPFWEESGMLWLSAIIGYLYEKRGPKGEPNIKQVLNLLCKARRELLTANELSQIMNEHHKKHPNSWAYQQYQKANVAVDRTLHSILIYLLAKLRNMESPALDKMLKRNELDIRQIGKRKTAVFVIVSDTDRSMDNLVNLFFTQVMNELCYFADEFCQNSSLPISVRFILDDFATNCRIEEFPRMISSIRSRGISVMLMIQAEAQLESGYGQDGRTIIGNCDTYVYLGGNDISTAKSVAERCDLPMKKILNMPIGHNWIFRRGSVPSYNVNFNLEEYIKELKKEEKTKEKGERQYGYVESKCRN